MEIYLDNSATTQCYPEVVEIVAQTMQSDYGNPSSMHMKGVEAEEYVKKATATIAACLKVQEKEIYFTSGGTESDNLAVIGSARAAYRNGKHIITTAIEHPAILNTMHYLEEQGYNITYLPVDEFGRIRLEDLKRAITPQTILVTIMHTNNEVGSLQPISEIGKLIKSINPRILFHVDAVQGFGRSHILPKKMGIDMLSVSGHKIHGPKGIGFLYIDERVRIRPITYGGEQQRGVRSGTLNAPGIAGIGKATEMIYANMDETVEQLYELKEYFINELSQIPEVHVNGCPKTTTGEWDVRKTASHIVNISVNGIRSEVLLHALEERKIYVSAGSACASHKKTTSSTLKSMGLTKDMMEGALRFSFSEFTTKEELRRTAEALREVIPMYSRFVRR